MRNYYDELAYTVKNSSNLLGSAWLADALCERGFITSESEIKSIRQAILEDAKNVK